MIKKIISGAQTGADRAGLDAAIDARIDHGGWCPAGRKAVDGVISDRYQLQETESSDYVQRTECNVKEADGTIIFSKRDLTRGASLTRALCIKHSKLYLLLDTDLLTKEYFGHVEPITLDLANNWLDTNNIEVLNVAGSRESKSPGIYALVYDFVGLLLLLE